MTVHLLLTTLVLIRQDEGSLERPMRLVADGKPIDTGRAWGYSGPALIDLDGDGKRDLVVGDFSGKFRHFRNVGSDRNPRYTEAGFLQAGGEDARVPIY